MKKLSTLFFMLSALLMLPQTVIGQEVVEFDFLNNNMNLPIGNANDINAGNLGGKFIASGDVFINFVNSPTMPTRYYSNSGKNQLQLIAGGQIRFSATEGHAITKIEITPFGSQGCADILSLQHR